MLSPELLKPGFYSIEKSSKEKPGNMARSFLKLFRKIRVTMFLMQFANCAHLMIDFLFLRVSSDKNKVFSKSFQ